MPVARGIVRARLLFALVLVAWLCVQPGTRTVRAITFNVLCGVPQLKAAIDDANFNSGPDVVSLAPNCTYTLDSAENLEFNGNNGLPIITDELVIEGNGATIERNSAGGTSNFRILRSTAGTLTVRNLTVRSGNLVDDDPRGAGIRTSADLVVENSTLSGNNIEGQVDSQGGATFSSGTTTIINSTYSGNTASSALGTALGGGAFSFAAMTVTNSTFTGNGVSSGNVALGGGTATMSTADVLNSTYTNNTSTGLNASAGGSQSQLAMTVTGSTFTGNTATGTGVGISQGVAIGAGSRADNTLTVTNSTYSANSAAGAQGAQGGGTYSVAATFIVTSTYSGNDAASTTGPGEGGGVYSQAGVSLTNSTISGNSAAGPGPVSSGGGTFSVLDTSVSNVTITANSATGSVSARGGGVSSINGIVMVNSIIALNTNGDCFAFGEVDASIRNIDSDSSCDGATTTLTPGMYPLALNAPGTSKTHALEEDGIAVNLGLNCEPFDQTGVTRPRGIGCDVGAWEAGYLPVDVDCDRDEDANDVLAVLRTLAGLESAPVAQLPCSADTDDDFDVDIFDAWFGRLWLAGLVN